MVRADHLSRCGVVSPDHDTSGPARPQARPGRPREHAVLDENKLGAEALAGRSLTALDDRPWDDSAGHGPGSPGCVPNRLNQLAVKRIRLIAMPAVQPLLAMQRTIRWVPVAAPSNGQESAQTGNVCKADRADGSGLDVTRRPTLTIDASAERCRPDDDAHARRRRPFLVGLGLLVRGEPPTVR